MKVAVLDDTREDAQRLLDYINRFGEQQKCLIQTDVYHASMDFLEEYHSQYDVIFLDIEMPGEDGLEVAHEIRKKDTAVGIIFVTNIAQYAIHGYEVNAIDFIVKPVGYFLFVEKLEKAMRFAKRRSKHDFVVNDEGGIYRIPIEEVFFVFSMMVTVFQYLVFTFMPGFLGEGLAGTEFMWSQVPMRILGVEFTWSLLGYNVLYDGAGAVIIGGGLGYFISYEVGSFLAQCINFPLQRNITFKSQGNVWYQAMWYFVAWIVISLICNGFNNLWMPIASEYVAPAVYNLLVTFITGGVSMVIFFFVFKIIFPEGEKK